MASQKIADFFAQIGIKVDEKSIKNLDKAFDGLERSLHNMEVSAKKAGSKISSGLDSFAKKENKLNKEMTKGNKLLIQRDNIRKRLRRQTEGPRQTIRAGDKVWGDLSYLDPVRKSMSNKAYNMQHAMYKSLFGDDGADVAEENRQKNLAKAQKEHAVRMERLARLQEKADKAKEKAARVAENVAKREQLMAQRTAAIREAGAKRAAAIIEAAEIRAQAMANRVARGGGSGGSGRGFSVMGGATVGGALGSASSSVAGLLPGFGAGWSLINLNRINQEIQANRLAMTAVTGSEQAGAEQSAWLENLANTVGFDYRQTMPAYTKMLASGTSSGFSTESVQNIFQGVSEYGRVMGLDTESMKGSMRALEQIMNKGQVMS